MKRALLLVLFACLIALAACGGTPPEEEPDLVATQVAVERAAAATLTAEAIAAAPSPTEAQTTPTQVVATVPPIIILPTPGSGTPQPTLVPPPTPTPTQIAGQIQPVFTPTRATPTPTPTQITAVVFPVDGSDGNQALRGSVIQSNGGRNVLLLGIDQAQVTTPMIFRERLPVAWKSSTTPSAHRTATASPLSILTSATPTATPSCGPSRRPRPTACGAATISTALRRASPNWATPGRQTGAHQQ
ncbi:MAG: hypothetical protein R2856_27310 [Caldilineaceae bacterium]